MLRIQTKSSFSLKASCQPLWIAAFRAFKQRGKKSEPTKDSFWVTPVSLGFFEKCDLWYQLVSNESRYFASCCGIFQSISKPIFLKIKLLANMIWLPWLLFFVLWWSVLESNIGFQYEFCLWWLKRVDRQSRCYKFWCFQFFRTLKCGWFFGNIDVCAFWHRFTVKYILNIKEKCNLNV